MRRSGRAKTRCVKSCAVDSKDSARRRRAAIAASLGVSINDIDAALLALEAEGSAMRGQYRSCSHLTRAPSPEPRLLRRSGAPAACSHAFIATRSSGCARKSSRCRRATSCGSCSNGSESRRRAHAGPRLCSRCARTARRLRCARERLGNRTAADAHRRVRTGLARRAVPRRSHRLDAPRVAQRRRRTRRGAGAVDADRAACPQEYAPLVVDRGAARAPAADAEGAAGRRFHSRKRRVVLRRDRRARRPPAESGRRGARRARCAWPRELRQLRRLARTAAAFRSTSSDGKGRATKAPHRDLRHAGRGTMGAGAHGSAGRGARGSGQNQKIRSPTPAPSPAARARTRSSTSAARSCAAGA